MRHSRARRTNHLLGASPKDSPFQAAPGRRRNYSPKDDLFSLGWRCRGLAVVDEEADGAVATRYTEKKLAKWRASVK